MQQKELQTFWLHVNSPPDGRKCCNLNMVRFLSQMTQLTSLRLTLSASMPAEVMNIFANMPCMVDIYLHTLSVFDKLPKSHHFPQCLQTFDLYGDPIKQDPMPVLEKLQCLVVLKLEGYNDRTMSCSSRGFPRLQNLVLLRFHEVAEWNIESGTMPKLSHLRLNRFSSISKLPVGLLHLPSLDHLNLQDVPLVSVEDDKTLNELLQKGCEVTI
jgi:hypothetical protein